MTNIHAAKTHLSSLLEKVEAGEEIVIARAGKPIARLVAYKENPETRTFGAMKGKIEISPDFDEPLDPETWGLEQGNSLRQAPFDEESSDGGRGLQ